MVQVILLNSAPAGQGSQKCLENKCTALVTSRKRRIFFLRARGDQRRSFSLSARWWTPTARWRKLKFSARWPKLCTYFRDIFGSPGQGGPSWAKWVSPLNSSMKTTTFKPNLYFYHRIPLKFSPKPKIFTQTQNFRPNLKFLPQPKILAPTQKFHPNLKFSSELKIFART